MIKRTLSIFALIVLSFGLQGCAREAGPEEACNFVQNSKMHRVSWGSETPITLYIDGSVPAQFHKSIEDAIYYWHAQSGRLLFKIGGQLGSSTKQGRDGANVIHWMSTWETDRAYEQARTTVYWAGDRIFESDIRINAKNFQFADGKVERHVDITSLMVHELGHVLGLAHTEEHGSVMVKSLASNTERREPSITDVSALKCEY